MFRGFGGLFNNLQIVIQMPLVSFKSDTVGSVNEHNNDIRDMTFQTSQVPFFVFRNIMFLCKHSFISLFLFLNKRAYFTVIDSFPDPDNTCHVSFMI